jgi:hypothetical protein
MTDDDGTATLYSGSATSTAPRRRHFDTLPLPSSVHPQGVFIELLLISIESTDAIPLSRISRTTNIRYPLKVYHLPLQ